MSSLEVWGDPIAHSLSPAIHAVAYAELGWDWTYGRRRVDEASFGPALAAHAPALRGLSLTYPLKTAAFAAARSHDRFAALTGAVNTYLLTASGPHGFNTDVGGLVADLRQHGVAAIDRARIVGAGATATSALVALGELGATRVEVVARRPEPVRALAALGDRIGVRVDALAVDATASAAPAAEGTPLTIGTLPGGAALPTEAATRLAAGGGLLYDVVYGTWPTPLAAAWQAAGGRAVNGLGMLVQQALRQMRVFAGADPDAPLPREDAVVGVMVGALVGD